MAKTVPAFSIVGGLLITGVVIYRVWTVLPFVPTDKGGLHVDHANGALSGSAHLPDLRLPEPEDD